jgi:hypothetical protein
MYHSIEIWRATINTATSALALVTGLSPEDLEHIAEGNDPVIELTRRYPALSREVAEYLAR